MSEDPADLVMALTRRLSLLEAERGITRTLYRYAHSVDRGLEEVWVSCFTPEGRFTVSSPDPDRPPIEVSGASALLSFAQGHTRPPELYHQHCTIQPLIDVDVDAGTARCVSYMYTFMRWNGIEPIMRTFGRYLDTFRRDAGENWLIEHRHAELDAVRPGLPPLGSGRGMQAATQSN